MGGRVSAGIGALAVCAWAWLILVLHTPAGWPHALYAVGVMLIIRGIALSTGRPDDLTP